MTHEELLTAYYRAERKVIYEYSGDIAKDVRHLHERCTRMATEHRLSFTEELDDWHKEDDDD